MATVSKIRLANILYEDGQKRYNDELFIPDSNNTAFVLENGGGKTVLVQMILQAVLPRHNHAGRKIWETLQLSSGAAHIAVEWQLNESPRRYLLTAVTLYLKAGKTASSLYISAYEPGDKQSIESLPFSMNTSNGQSRPASHGEVSEYYQRMSRENPRSRTFDTLKNYHEYLEKNYQLSHKEWLSISKINSSEGGIEAFFDNCATTPQLVNNLLIPTIEEAIEGENTELFADIFDAHRQHIKEYKRLTSVIEENRHIQENINGYVSSYKAYHEENTVFHKKKSIIKGLYSGVKHEEERVHIQLGVLAEEKKQIILNQSLLNQEKKAYTYQKKNKECLDAKAQFEMSKTVLDEVEVALEKNQLELDKLELAKRINLLKNENTNLDVLENRLKTMESSEDAVTMSEEKDGYMSSLSYLFRQELDRYENERIVHERELNVMSSQIGNAKAEIKGVHQKISEHDSEIGLKNGEKRTLAKAISDNHNMLIGLKDLNLSRQYQQECTGKLRELNKEEMENRTRLSSLKQEIADFEISFPDQDETIKTLGNQIATIETKIESIEKENRSIAEAYVQLTGKKLIGKDCYTATDDIISSISQQIKKMKDEKERLICREAEYNYKFAIHQNKEYFSAEPSLEEKAKMLSNTYGYVETGVRYLTALYDGDALENLCRSFPYWPLTLVTLESEKESIWNRLMMDNDKIELPIILLSDREVKQLADGSLKLDQLKSVVPKIWNENVDEEKFEAWKNIIQSQLIEHKKEREICENQLKKYHVFMNRVQTFLTDYPQEVYLALRDELSNTRTSLNQHTTAYEEKLALVSDMRTKIETYTSRNAVITEEVSVLGSQLEKVQKIIVDQRRLSEIEKEILLLNEKRETWVENRKKIEQSLEIIDEEFNQLKDSLRNVDANKRLIEDSRLYKTVCNYEPVFTTETRGALEIRLDDVMRRLMGIESERSELEARISVIKSRCKELTLEIEEELNRLDKTEDDIEPYVIEEDVNRVQRLKQSVKKLKDEQRQTSRLTSDYKGRFERLSGSVQTLEEDYLKVYDEMVKFDIPLEMVENALKNKQNIIDSKHEELEKKESKIKILHNEIEQVIREMETQNGRYDFLQADIEISEISESLNNDYQYNRLKTVKALIKKLEIIQRNVEGANEKKNKVKEQFKRFCHDQITDPKLKNSTLSFIEKRDTYAALCSWQENINAKIDQVVRMSEINLKEVDSEIVKLIDRLYLYLKKVVQELSILESKTRVKLKNDNKRIFKITVPEFSEYIAKQNIRDHLIWMANKIQTGEYLNDEGREDTSAMKKDIMVWLSTKRLFSKIFMSKEISVKCRKVTNDFLIKGQLTDWGNTMKWSGGEKWSKNMTLYLGIQNYLAEKRYVDTARNKRNRTVLLDNPFGAASSSHVLEPVFLIAQQLGYQLIAFTAHAEGKFISDYFPVVYSCKLRSSNEDKVQIMTKQKEINYAFLMEHNPKSIYRIEEDEYEQLNLFSSLLNGD